RMNVGLIPRTQSAFEDYQRWLLPEYVGLERVDPMQSDLGKNKPGAALIQETGVRVSCFWETCVLFVLPQPFSGDYTTTRGSCFRCILLITFGGGSSPPSSPGPGTDGGNSCWETDSCRPNTGGDRRDGLDRTGCDGDPAAFRDHCGRCVGGDTDRLPARPGDDCNNLNIPCAGDVVKNPEITSPGASGKTGGRFRPCVGTPCLEELRAVRNDGVDPHHGTDITCTVGDPIYAPFDMSGLERGYQVNSRGRGYGYFVRGWATVNGERRNFGVAHLQEARRASGSIKRGDIIGYCGRSGITDRDLTTHAHLEWGTQVVFFSGTRSSLLNPELVLSTKFANTSEANPLNANPCGQE
ncbi:MAG: M23 family metallopeptidase, partial [Balneolales bacterium]|nr:M23 family metallopeptidase [Balneolales bacterium]